MLYILVYFHILCIQFKIITNSLITLFARLDVVIGILLTCGKHVHDCIISLRGEIWTHKTLTRQFLLKCLYQSRKVSDNVFVCLYCECDSDATSDKFLAMAERCDILMQRCDSDFLIFLSCRYYRFQFALLSDFNKQKQFKMEPYFKTLQDDMVPIIHLYLMHMSAVWLMYQRLWNRRNRKMYSRPIFAQRRRHGDYSHLVQEMRLDPEYHFMYFRMSVRQFEKLAEIVCPYLQRHNYALISHQCN